MAHHRHAHFHLHRSLHLDRIFKRAQSTPIAQSAIEERAPEPAVLAPRATKSCVSTQESNTCQLPADAGNNLSIILGVVIPVVICIIACIILHRKYLARQRREDNDKHKSLDFGTEIARKMPKGKKGQKIPEMSAADVEKSVRHGRGLSMDMDLSSPYILPSALKGSRESLHSMSRSMKDDYDPYRPVTMVSESARTPSNLRGDGGSTYTGRTVHSMSSHGTEATKSGLLPNARSMGSSRPQLDSPDSMSPPLSATTTVNGSILSKTLTPPLPPPPPVLQEPQQPEKSFQRDDYQQKTSLAPPQQQEPDRDSYFEKNAQTFLNDETFIPSAKSTSGIQLSQSTHSSPPQSRITSNDVPSLPVISLPEDDTSNSNWDAYQLNQQASGSLQEPVAPHYEHYEQDHEQQGYGLGIQQPEEGNHRLSMSFRPLPPEDPNEDAESRANRIRSFYKEYFDDSRPNPGGMRMPKMGGYNDYYEDYGQEYLGDGAIFDPESGQFIVAERPYAEPVTRRAMTPPPRAPPRFRGAGMHSPAGSFHSTGTFAPPPRGFSAMSNRRPGSATRKPIEPPKPLKSIPTPGLMKDDSNLIFDSTEFAPPVSFRDRQAGRRPDSPLGGQRPYSPSVKAFNPLTSSYDDLNAIPSPHMLRKSGTFTSLDFAPPTRLRDIDSGSDAASIRSGRSGLSQAQMYNMRAGAYRISRLPKELAGTKNEITASLRPNMDMTMPA